ncbi:hypothetical protein BDQ12DRAFT_734000 [Crucibulum laeve]|uniref:Uncharacterized protein n=1 Tax=Crucibulum laeve TaxID=68775 RepID=A0A5C3M7I7_9AGAR|nr:hypothetical protein BDQ12DRAFT_734000 [Crucibulum laeve]
MDTIRRRVPFKFSEEKEEKETEVLDEQEQDELIEKLRRENEISNRQYLVLIRVVLALSALLQFVFLFSPSKSSPLFSLFPAASVGEDLSMPLPTLFIMLSLFVHLNLAFLFHPNEIRMLLQLNQNPSPLSYELLYTLSAVPPTLSAFLWRPWQTTLWWCFTPMIVFIVHTVMSAIDNGNESIADLETMKYVAPGA